MCGRFTLTASGEELAEVFGLAEVPSLAPRYNIAPTQPIAAIRLEAPGGPRILTSLRWGIVPGAGPLLINARSETVDSRPVFREAFASRRCLIPADGFYEWTREAGRKRAIHFRLKTGRPFAFAGIWARAAPGDEIDSGAILTTEPNDVLRPIHDRMPVILDPAGWPAWLDPRPDPDTLRALLVSYPAGEMSSLAVSSFVNSASHEGPECLGPPEGVPRHVWEV